MLANKSAFSGNKRRIIIGIVCSGAFLASLGQSMLTSSIPVLAEAFNVSEVTAEWLTTGYILVLGLVSALTAFLINRFATKKLFLASMLLHTAGLVCSLISTNFAMLLLSRVVQAFGAGVLLPLAQIVVLNLTPKEQQGRAFAIIGVVIAIAPSIGPTLAGILLDSFGWQSIFALLLILAASLLTAGCFCLVNVGETFNDSLDILSALLYAAGFCLLLIGVSNFSCDNIRTAIPIAIGILLLMLFVKRSCRLPQPLLRLELFRRQEFRISFTLVAICYLASMAAIIQMPLYIQTVCGHTATVSGLVTLPAALVMFVANPIGGILLDKKGARYVAIFGMMLLILGNLPFCIFDKNTSLILISVCFLLRSFGMIIVLNPLTAHTVGSLTGAEVSHGNAIVASLRQMIGTVGSSILVALAAAASYSQQIDAYGINVSFAAQTVLYVFGLLMAILFMQKPTPKAAK